MSDKVCPKCNNRNIEKGIIRGAGAVVQMFPYDNLRSASSSISSVYCANCGYVFDLYAENPENLLPNTEYSI